MGCNIAIMKRFLLLAIISSLSAQYSFDVKTTYNDKAFKGELRSIKQGVIHSIETSSWAEIKDFGEDYSLWISRPNRTHLNDSLTVKVLIQLRSPAMITMGDFIDQKEIVISYHWEEMQTASDSIDKSMFKEKQEKSVEIAKSLTKLAKGVSIISGDFTNTGIDLLTKVAMTNLGSIIGSNPSPVAVMESLLIGQQTLDIIEGMVKEHESLK